MGILEAAVKISNKIGINVSIGNNTLEHSNFQNKIKKSKIRGKALTFNQKKILMRNGLEAEEVDFYLIQKISFLQEGSEKRLNKSNNKVEQWTLIHRDTGELRGVYIK